MTDKKDEKGKPDVDTEVSVTKSVDVPQKKPDHELPEPPKRPDNALPGDQPGIDNTLPGGGGRPDNALPGDQPGIDNTLPTPPVAQVCPTCGQRLPVADDKRTIAQQMGGS